MHLKTLSLVGFKSFADRTRLVFEPGVTVVVGPNGSGKSNLVDAIAWVMGTQATKALRSEKMDDLIFAGTALRPAHGRAEVSLTFDNESGGLPIDLAEVTVTRRLNRDGTSDYEINGTPCRLLDIQELLSDGGIGRHQHVIVGQGRVGAVLNASPEEHRAIIEEAAGVIKHRARRDRAVRRLEATEIDVQRLHDLLGEQRRLMRPLKRQANAAEIYDTAKAQWRGLRLWLGGEHLRAIDGRLAEIATGDSEIRTRVGVAESRLAEIAAGLGALQAAAGEAGRALERDTAAAARLETAIERLQRIAMVAGERRRAMQNSLEQADGRRRDLEAERVDLQARLTAASGEEAALRKLAERHEIAFHALEDEERSLAGQGEMPAEGVVATLRGDLAALEAADRRDAREAAALRQRLEVVDARIAEEESEADRLRSEIRRADRETDPAQKAYDRTVAGRRRAQEALESAEEAVRTAGVALAAGKARAEALGTGPSDDAVAAASGVVGPLVARLDVPDELVAAVDGTLGEWGDAWAVEGPAALETAAAAAAGSPNGASFVVPVAAAEGLPDTNRLIDRLGPACDRKLAEALLGDVVVVDTWHQGWTLVEQHPLVRAVTLSGDVVTRFGIKIGDPSRGRAAREAAAAAVARAVTEDARASSRLTTSRRAFDEAREAERVALEALEAVDTRIAGATEALRLVERSQSESAAEAERLRSRTAALDEVVAGRTERLVGLRTRLDAFSGEEAVRQAAWEALTNRREAVAVRRDAARHHREEAASALAAVEERSRMLARRLEEVTEVLDGPGEIPIDPAEIARLTAVEERARIALGSSRRHLGVLRERQRTLREEAGHAGTVLDETYTERDRMEPIVAEGREQLSVLAIEAAELRVRRESEAEGLRRDADAPEEAALEAAPVEIPEGADPIEHLASLEAQLRRIGPINPLAAAEYRELAERSDFLEAQLADLDDSRRELAKVISALDDEIARLFMEAFAEIAGHYEASFGELFPGGKGRLTLTDPDHPLETGVTVHAQPMGKRVSKLSLLSGGERSLAAIAFLFAVFRARPSPFYVLDEVEAALDDANLRRFIRLVGTLSDQSQLVIVTHQQQTMEAADLLYGVTMEPGETSRILAKRLTGVQAASGDAA
ncbi:MAG: chromosome segregation protein SMC [Acidimicrobiia bacterium]|nr:chromosome segregation protein SMC [Acidimicrobiia bacterium]